MNMMKAEWEDWLAQGNVPLHCLCGWTETKDSHASADPHEDSCWQRCPHCGNVVFVGCSSSTCIYMEQGECYYDEKNDEED